VNWRVYRKINHMYKQTFALAESSLSYESAIAFFEGVIGMGTLCLMIPLSRQESRRVSIKTQEDRNDEIGMYGARIGIDNGCHCADAHYDPPRYPGSRRNDWRRSDDGDDSQQQHDGDGMVQAERL
jgi:hypothetical protein